VRFPGVSKTKARPREGSGFVLGGVEEGQKAIRLQEGGTVLSKVMMVLIESATIESATNC